MPTSQELVIKTSLEGINKVVSGIAKIESAWSKNHKTITQNLIKETEQMTKQAAAMAKLGTAVAKYGSEYAKQQTQQMKLQAQLARQQQQHAAQQKQALTQAANYFNQFATSASGAINKVAGKLSFLSGTLGTVGKAIGLALGGPAGMAIGGGIGQMLGSTVGAIVNIPFQIMGAFGKAAKFVLDQVGKIGGAIKNLFFGPVSLFGLFLGKQFMDIGQGIQQTVQEIYDATVAFQQLSISIDTLTKREIARTKQIDITQVSTEDLSNATADLFNWLRDVSLTSPFTMASIADAMKFASAMGLAIDTVKELTMATGNFAAAMGLSEDHQYRIMYNLAQIYQQGKLTGREFRDLAISFVPVYDILGEMAKEAGMSTEAFKKLALEGGVPVEDFFEHFITYMDENFPDAMTKMARTMIGVKNNIADFIQVVLGMEMLGPVIGEISGRIADVLNALMTPRMHRLARDFGEGLRLAFLKIAEAVDYLGEKIKLFLSYIGVAAPTVDNFANALVFVALNIKYAIEFIGTVVNLLANAVNNYIMPIIRSLGGAQEESGAWGVNLIANFAQGIVYAAGVFLAKAILYVAAMIKAFFAPGSPPKVAPKIDDWGGDLINEYIDGMVNNADYSKLSKVGEKLAGEFAPQVSTGNLTPPWSGAHLPTPEPGVDIPLPPGLATPTPATPTPATPGGGDGGGGVIIPRFLTESGIQAAIDFMNGFSSEMFDALDAMQSPLKSALDSLVGLGMMSEQTGLETFYNFSQDMIAALDAFNETGEISQGLLDEISQLGMGLGPELAELVQKEFDLAQAVKDAAAAQERLDNAVKALSEARGTVRGLVKEYNDLLRAGAGRDVLRSKLQEVNAAEQVVQQAEDEQYYAQQNKDLADQRVDDAKEAAALQEKMLANINELLNAQIDALNKAAGAGGDLSSELDNIVQELGTIASTPLDLPIIDWDAKFKEMEPDIAAWWAQISTSFATGFNSTINSPQIQTAATTFAETIKSMIAQAFGVEEGNAGPQGASRGLPADKRSFAQKLIEQIFSGSMDWTVPIEWVTTQLTNIIGGAVETMTGNLTKEDTLTNDIINLGIAMGTIIVQGIWSSIFGGLNTAVGNLYASPQFQGGFVGVDTTVEVNPTEIKFGDLSGYAQGLWELAGKPDEWTYNGVKVIDVPTTATITQSDPNLKKQGETIGEETVAGIGTGMTGEKSLQLILESVGSIFKNLWEDLVDIFDSDSPAQTMVPLGEDIVAGIMQGISDFVKSIIGPEGAIATEVNKIIDSFKSFFGLDPTGTTTTEGSFFYNLGKAILQGLVDGLMNMEDALRTAWEWIVSKLPEWARKLLGMQSPSKVMMKIGENTVKGFALGINSSSDLIKKAVMQTIPASLSIRSPNMNLTTMARASYYPYMRTTAPSVSRNTNLNFGDVYLRDNMDYATFRAMVQNVISER